jgi:hypothetical protein
MPQPSLDRGDLVGLHRDRWRSHLWPDSNHLPVGMLRGGRTELAHYGPHHRCARSGGSATPAARERARPGRSAHGIGEVAPQRLEHEAALGPRGPPGIRHAREVAATYAFRKQSRVAFIWPAKLGSRYR